MDPARGAELVIGLLAALAVLAAIARWLSLPYPVLFVLGGLALAAVPTIPTVSLDPGLVFLIFLPPLIYAAGALTSLRELRANLFSIAMLAIGLVLVTMVVAALVARAVVPGLSWLTALVLGAIISPTDASAALALSRRVRVPRELTTLIEGESLFNDGTALVLYGAAVAAAASGSLSVVEVAPGILVAIAGGVAIGLAVGWVLGALRHLRYVSEDRLVEITVSLLTPFVAWMLAEQIGVSGVIAVVSAGVYVGRTRLSQLPSATRVLDRGFWELLEFGLEGMLFILVGLQLRTALSSVADWTVPSLILPALLLSATVIALRVVWVPLAIWASRLVPAAERGNRVQSWRHALVAAWSGTRGGVSLAAALALPYTLPDGQLFPGRGEAVFLTYGVVLVTLLLQSPTLPVLVRWLGVDGDEITEREELLAREEITRAAVGRVGEVAEETNVPKRTAEQVRMDLERGVRAAKGELDERQQARVEAERQLRREAIAAQRAQVIRLRDEGVVTDEVLRRIERELDLQELRLDEI